MMESDTQSVLGSEKTDLNNSINPVAIPSTVANTKKK